MCGTPSGLASGPKACLDGMPCVLPTTPPYAGGPGYIPLGEVDLRARYRVELGQTFIRPQSSERSLPSCFPAFFHESCSVPAFPY